MTDKKSYHSLKDIDEIISILNKISIFGGLNNEQLNIIFNELQSVKYSKDEFIFKTGDPPTHIYIVKKGLVRLLLDDGNFRIEKAVFDEGQCFGETAVLGIQPHIADTIAATDTELIVLSRKALLHLYETNVELFSLLILNIARELCRRLRFTEDILLHYVGTTAFS